jgi:DNA-binding response OmpR family regulator
MSKILIVEDDVIIREELAQFLENAGHEVVAPICTDNTVNTNTIYDNNPDLILLDVNLLSHPASN